MNYVHSVRIINRGDKCGDRLAEAEVYVGDTLFARLPKKTKDDEMYTLESENGGPVLGDKIKVVMTQNNYLHFVDINVYGVRADLIE